MPDDGLQVVGLEMLQLLAAVDSLRRELGQRRHCAGRLGLLLAGTRKPGSEEQRC